MIAISLPVHHNWNDGQLQKLKDINGVAEVVFTTDQQLEIGLHELILDVISQILIVFNEIELNSSILVKKFEINNLSCDGCANSAMRILKNQIGIYFSHVSFLDKSASICYDESLISSSELKNVVAQLGYDLVID